MELAWFFPLGLLHFWENSSLLAVNSPDESVFVNGKGWQEIICRSWSTLACFGLKNSSYILPLLALKNRVVVLCSSTSLSVHHLGQFLHFFGAQESVFNIFSAELLSYLEFIFSCISSSFFSRCSWGVWDLQNDFLGFWLLWSCSWQNVFPKMEPLDLLRLVLLWFEIFLLHSKDCSRSSERFHQVCMACFGMGIFHFSGEKLSAFQHSNSSERFCGLLVHLETIKMASGNCRFSFPPV